MFLLCKHLYLSLNSKPIKKGYMRIVFPDIRKLLKIPVAYPVGLVHQWLNISGLIVRVSIDKY